ncbi:MAG: phytanoyl-CoA dioxygenase family protein [Chitinophagales bacterium]|nr:phytanoyl-CoA dioxygenase family protein [Bacteroidota bacterium]
MRTVLNDTNLEAEFQKNGYVIIPFLNDTEVQSLRTQYFDTLSQSGGLIQSEDAGIQDMITYDFTFIDKNIDYKRLVFDVITQAFAPHVKKYLANYTPIIANFIRKKTKNGEVPLHQNWAFVDEAKCTSVSIWCPLVDSNEANGTLQVVPGSHKRFGKVRGPMVPWELENIKHKIIEKYLVPMNVKAGQAVILDDSLVHYSAINQTDDLRLAIQLILIPEEEKSIHYHMDASKHKNKVEVLEVDREFYMEFNPWKKAENVHTLKTIAYKPFDMSIKEFDNGIFGKRIDEEEEKVGLFDKLKAVFS